MRLPDGRNRWSSGRQTLLYRLIFKITKYTFFRSLDISANKLSRYPPELQLLKNLKVLNVSNNRLTEINVAKLTKLESIICRSNLILQFPNVSLCRNLKTVRDFIWWQTHSTKKSTPWFQFRWLKVRGIAAAFLVSIALFYNRLK